MAAQSLQECEIMAGSPPKNMGESLMHDNIPSNTHSITSTSSSARPKELLKVNEAAMLDSFDNSLSPKSPSSMYTKCIIERSKGCVIHSFLLCYWDNIIGPKISHLWKTENEKNSIKQDELSYVASRTLSGEICRNPTDASIDTQFCVVKDRGIIVTSFIFGAIANGEAAVHSLSMIVPYSNLKIFLNVHDLCVSWMSRLVSRLRVLIVKESEVVMACFSGYLTTFVEMLNSLRESGIPRSIPLADTAFHPQHKFNLSLLRRAITSHLLTCGRTVVIGNAAGKINLMLATLAMFVSPPERYCCRYAVEDKLTNYQPDLVLQGIVKTESNQELADSLQDLFLSHYPSSLVDLRVGEVKLSGLPHEHNLRRQTTIQQELESLWKGFGGSEYPTSDMFHTIDDPETIVSNFIEEMYLLPPLGGLREAFVRQFMTVLDRKAVSLLKYVKSEMRQHKLGMRESVKKLKHDLALTVPGDYLIVLATAEKLNPGIFAFLCGESMSDAEFRHYLDKS